MRGLVRSLLLSTSLLALGCGGAPPVVSEPPPPAPPPTLVASAPRLAEGVTQLDPVCAEGTEERCDAVDQDCDGRIDEGCEGATDAPFVVSVAWNGTADVDLVLSAPEGVSPDREARGCDGPRLERASISQPHAGPYRVEVAHAGPCGEPAPVTVSVSLSVNGAALGPFNRTLAPGERAAIVELDLLPE